jgi:hypothetical protein
LQLVYESFRRNSSDGEASSKRTGREKEVVNINIPPREQSLPAPAVVRRGYYFLVPDPEWLDFWCSLNSLEELKVWPH